MVCGYCKKAGFRKFRSLRAHWRETGCPTYRPVWVRVMESRKRGHSGKRILHEAFPNLYPSKPMDDETKERFRQIEEEKKAEGVMVARKYRRTRRGR